RHQRLRVRRLYSVLVRRFPRGARSRSQKLGPRDICTAGEPAALSPGSSIHPTPRTTGKTPYNRRATYRQNEELQMTKRVVAYSFLAVAGLGIGSLSVSGQAQSAPPLVITAYNGGAPIPYTVPRTPWGDPD